MIAHMMRMVCGGQTRLLAAFGLAILLGGCAEEPPPFAGPEPYVWPKDVVQTFSELPIQESGRVKPLSTFARFKLLKFSAGTSFTLIDGAEKRGMSAMEWLLDVMFFPEVARHYKCFTVDDDQVLKAVGLSIDGRKKRDRYSYHELQPVQEKLRSLAIEYDQIDPKQRSTVQAHTLRLASSLFDYSALTSTMTAANVRASLGGADAVKTLFDGRDEVPIGEVLANLEDVFTLAQTAIGEGDETIAAPYKALLSEFDRIGDVLFAAHHARAEEQGMMALVPGHDHDEAWWSFFTVYQVGFGGHSVADRSGFLDRFGALAAAATVKDLRATIADEAAFADAATSLHDDLSGIAIARGEYNNVPTEVSFYAGKNYWFNPWFFLVAFLLVALGWAFPSAARRLGYAAIAIVGVSTVLMIIGITYRCIIRGRPPVSTLYETILFITAVGLIVCLVIEKLVPRRIALGVAAAMGTIGMFLANRYELHEATDTMPQLNAVLDTNFWLATHVTSISVGYAAGLFAAAVAHIYLAVKMFKGDPGLLKSIGRITYGLVCFGLLFSTVGTILGGIWANDSWGRFWGWDPKENGALLIVLAFLGILHGRLGGYLRDQGIAVASILCGFVVVFSWWGVNLLGVGLHSYGFTSGAAAALQTFYLIECAFLGTFGMWWLYSMRGTETTASG